MSVMIVTGSSGLIGCPLVRALLREGHLVFGVDQHSEEESWKLEKTGKWRFFRMSLFEIDRFAEILSKKEVDCIFHLAATRESQNYQLMHDNIMGTASLIEAVKKSQAKPRILFLGSAAQYGRSAPTSGEQLTEDAPMLPVTPYGVSKAACDLLGYQAFKQDGLDIVRVRLFNTIGPGLDTRFFPASIAKQVVEIEKGKKEPVLKVRHLASRRDFVDIRDVVGGLQTLMEKGHPGEVYQIASGKSTPLKDLMKMVIAQVNLQIRVETEQETLGDADIEGYAGSIEKIRSQTRWQPQIALKTSVEDMVNDWRKRSN